MSNPLDPFTIGLLMLFGSVGIGLPLGALVGWRSRFEWGIACGLLCIAAGGLGGAGQLAAYVARGSLVAEAARPVRCEEIALGEGSNSWVRIDHLEVAQPGGGALALRLPFVTGRCPDTLDARPLRLRYARADVSRPGAGPVMAEREDDPRQPWAMVGVLCAFGGFGLLAGLFFVLQARAESSPARTAPAAAEPLLPPWRRRLGNSVMQAGNISLLAGMLIGGFEGGSAKRSVAICFGTAAVACVEYLVAFALLRRVSGQVALILLIVGGGCAMAAWAVLALG